MMNAWELPTCLCVGGENWKIRTDFRAILDILKYFNDPEYEPDEQWEICLDILYEDYANMPYSIRNEAAEKAIEFIDMGIRDDGRRKPHTMDWEQDAAVIIPSVNRVLGKEVRALDYLHWWTFMGAYMEIGCQQNVFSTILHIREKLSKGIPQSKWEKWEKDYYKENKKLVDLKVNRVERSQEEKDELRKLFGFK